MHDAFNHSNEDCMVRAHCCVSRSLCACELLSGLSECSSEPLVALYHKTASFRERTCCVVLVPLKTEVLGRTKSRSVLSEDSLFLCIHTCFCIYVYICTVCVWLWVCQCVTETVWCVVFIYLIAEEVNKWSGQPLPKVTLDFHAQHAHLLALRPRIISTRGPWGPTDPPPSAVPPSQSHAIRTAHSGPGPQLTFSAVCHDVARGADKPCFSSPPSPQKGGGGAYAKVDRFNSCWVIHRKSFVKI